MQYFPPPPPATAPPAPVHKVWILDCKSCGTFLTNRGMKAVLLLRPNVPLYSTDALPVNCAAYTAPSPSPSYALPPNAVPRTCDCLTQSLHCTTCGAGVGYTIVTPCARCTSSISASQRATNGHRFVFYASEVAAGERGHVPGERGVHPYRAPPAPAPCPERDLLADLRRHRETVARHARPSLSLSPSAEARDSERERTESTDSMPSLVSVSDTSAPPSPAAPRGARPTLSPARFPPPLVVDLPLDAAQRAPLLDLRQVRAPAGRARTREEASPQPPPPPPTRVPPSPDVSRPGPDAQRLRAGDVLYWHHLVRSGEIPAVVEDHRARPRRRPEEEGGAEGKDARAAGAKGQARRGSVSVPVKSVVLAGR
ncbi:FAM72 protein-domain-containing protein [Rhodofomes roseus]|uniref:FAM72 protein-domain-containing protein n=1 Tax=Rhodofomes roseus TaxID=34475 RepID=A0ABQ8K6I2_9APHY|nr:FAM72 protein-domain-containing protein [Rhodofomes roseus]KAH9832321.1 FAM72 protein-domain-containing protein [Rhodofomes roseus]